MKTQQHKVFLFSLFVLHLLMGTPLSAQDLQQNLAQHERRLQQNPQDPDANYNMAQAYFLMGKTDEAIRFLERTIYLAPKDSQAMLRLATIYRKIGKLGEARDLLLTAGSLDEKNVEIWYELGVVYSDLADYQAGIAAFQKALHLSNLEEQKFQIIYYTGILHLSNRDEENFKDCLRRLKASEKFYAELEKLGKLWLN